MSSRYIGRILIVDDDAKLRFILKAGIGAAGFEVLEGVNGQEAVGIATEQQPDLIVMDVGMPVMDGIEATRELQARESTKHIPILILTAQSRAEDVVVALEAGAQEHLGKPFDITELLARVRTMHRLVLARTELDELNDTLENEVNVKTRRLQILYDCIRDLNQAGDKDTVLDLLIGGTQKITEAKRISIMLTDAAGENLVCERAVGIDPGVVGTIRVKSVAGISGQVFQSGKTLAAVTLGEGANSDRGYDSDAFLSAPLKSNSREARDSILGVINLTDKGDSSPFSHDEIDCVRSVADASAIALDNLNQRDQLQMSVRVLLKTVGHLAEYRDEETTLHLERVSKMAGILGTEISKHGPYRAQISEEFIDMLIQAAPLHDIGKVGIPDEILTKPGKLTDGEFTIMKTHTEIGRRVLSMPLDPQHPVPLLTMCIDIAFCHHERYDGRGYPRGVKGGDIPLSARIVTLVDAYDAITSRRRYKRERSHEDAVEIMREEAGRHFDPVIVEMFHRCSEQFDAIRARYADSPEALEASLV